MRLLIINVSLILLTLGCSPKTWNGLQICNEVAWTGGEYVEEEIVFDGSQQDSLVLYRNGDDQRWEKRPDSTGSMIWCLVSLKGYEVKVAKPNSDEPLIIRQMKEISPASRSRKVRVICPKNMSESLVREVQQKLATDHFYVWSIDGQWTNETLYALMMYQRAHRLPKGGLNIRTLEHMQLSMASQL